jgi:hypothetical protein
LREKPGSVKARLAPMVPVSEAAPMQEGSGIA